MLLTLSMSGRTEKATAESYYFCALAIASISTWALELLTSNLRVNTVRGQQTTLSLQSLADRRVPIRNDHTIRMLSRKLTNLTVE